MGFFDLFKRFAPSAQATKVGGDEITYVSDKRLNDLALAEAIYANTPPWLNEEKPALTGAGLGGLIAAEVARLITIESKISVDSDAAINDIYQRYVTPNLRAEVEKGWALGGLIFKPSYKNATFKLDSDNRVKHITGNMKIDFFYPSQFLISDYDNAGMVTEIMFFTTVAYEHKCYTLVEKQSYDESNITLTITNKVYKTSSPPKKYKWDDLGTETVPLETIEQWQNLPSKILFSKVRGTLIGFYKPAIANNTDIQSPYGLSGLVRAAQSIRRADITYNQLEWEMDASLARLYIDETALSITDNLPGKLTKYIVKLLGNDNKRYFEKYSPEIREQSYLNTYNAHLRQIEDIVGLAHGTLSNAEEIAKTATEIAMMKQRTYAMVVDNQKALEMAIRQLVYAINAWKDPAHIGNDIDMTFDFDDSIVSNPAEQTQILLQLQAAGNIPAYRTNMTYFNVSAEEAQKIVEEARLETFQVMNDTTEDELE